MNHNFFLSANFAKHQRLITNADTDLQNPMGIRCNVAGTAIVTCEDGTVCTYTMAVGEVLPVMVTRVAAASSGTFHGFW